jgi:hypothetical protein
VVRVSGNVKRMRECDRCGKTVNLKGMSEHRRENAICRGMAIPESKDFFLSAEDAWNYSTDTEEGSDDDYWQN